MSFYILFVNSNASKDCNCKASYQMAHVVICCYLYLLDAVNMQRIDLIKDYSKTALALRVET